MGKVYLSFRVHPELEPTGKVSLLGRSLCSAARIHAYVRRRDPMLPEVAEQYVRLGQQYGIRGDVAYCQMVYEARGWASQLTGPYWEPLKLEQWTDEAAIERQMQLLYSLATRKPHHVALDDVHLKAKDLTDEERTSQVICWEDLKGEWSRPNHRYGQDIVAIWRNMLEWKGGDK